MKRHLITTLAILTLACMAIFYDQVAQAMGCFGERVEDPREITPALKRAVESGKPAVLDVIVDRWANLNPPDLENLDAVWMEGCDLPW